MMIQFVQKKVSLLFGILSFLLLIPAVHAQEIRLPEEQLNDLINQIIEKHPPRLAPSIMDCIGKVFPLVGKSVKGEVAKARMKNLMMGCMLKKALDADARLGVVFDELSHSEQPEIIKLFSVLAKVQEGTLDEHITAFLPGITIEQLNGMVISDVHEKVFQHWLLQLPTPAKNIFDKSLQDIESQKLSQESKNGHVGPYRNLAEYVYLVRLLYDYQLFVHQVTHSQACFQSRLPLLPFCEQKKTCQILEQKNKKDEYQYACLTQNEWSFYFAKKNEKSIFDKCNSLGPKHILLQAIHKNRLPQLTPTPELLSSSASKELRLQSQLFFSKIAEEKSAFIAADRLIRWAAIAEQLRAGYFILGKAILDVPIPQACESYRGMIQSSVAFMLLDKEEKSLQLESPEFLMEIHQEAKLVMQQIDSIKKIEQVKGRGTNGDSRISQIKSEIIYSFLRYPFLLGNYFDHHLEKLKGFVFSSEEAFWDSIFRIPPKLLLDFAKNEDVAELRKILKNAHRDIQELFYEEMAKVCKAEDGYQMMAMVSNRVLRHTVTSQIPALIPLYECIADQQLLMEKNKKFLRKVMMFGCPTRMSCELGNLTKLLVESYFTYQEMGSYLNPADIRTEEQKRQIRANATMQVQSLKNTASYKVGFELQKQLPFFDKIIELLK